MITRHFFTRLMILFIAIFLPCECLLAADTEVVFGSDPPDAAKGHIFVRAVVESGYESGITVELYPYGDECVPHRYELSADNGFGVSDDIRTGEYDYISYAQDEKVYTSHVPRTITVTEEEPSYFTVVAGSREFTREYEWLSSFIKDGSYLSGVITPEEAEELYEYSVSRQWGDGEVPVTDETHPEEDVSEAGTQGPEQEIITPEDEKDERPAKPNMPAAVIFIPLFIVIVTVLLLGKRKRK